MFLLYDFIFVVFAVLYLPYLLIRGKWHSGFKMRWGDFTDSKVHADNGKPSIWVHAVSVGEVLAVADLIKKIHLAYPQYGFVCTTVTETGQAIANEQLGSICRILYAPLDFSRIVRKYISVIQPKLYISTETEIWPNLYTALHKRSVPIVQVNGRISDRSFKSYKLVRILMKRVLSCVDVFFMQSELDAKRIKDLGADPEKVRVAGNLKFDLGQLSTVMIREDFGINDDEKVIVAGSTHPGEEEILLNVYEKLIDQWPGLKLIIAPRHVDRSEDIVKMIVRKGQKVTRLSENKFGADPWEGIILIDTIGKLRQLYALADVVFIGKTLKSGGGQNMIEPAGLGKAVIVGPMTENFKDAVGILKASNAIVQVRNAEELAKEIKSLLEDAGRAQVIGHVARETVLKHQGATDTTMAGITGILNGKH